MKAAFQSECRYQPLRDAIQSLDPLGRNGYKMGAERGSEGERLLEGKARIVSDDSSRALKCPEQGTRLTEHSADSPWILTLSKRPIDLLT